MDKLTVFAAVLGVPLGVKLGIYAILKFCRMNEEGSLFISRIAFIASAIIMIILAQSINQFT